MANTAKSKVTDRALRYRARAAAPSKTPCLWCGGKSSEVAHIDGKEENTNPENLGWTCRSCNVKTGLTLRDAKLGRRTRQYNPGAKGTPRGAQTLGAYVNSIGVMKGEVDGDVGAAVDLIHNTSAAQRSRFAHQIWSLRRQRKGNPIVKKMSARSGGAKRQSNPADGASDLYEEFHGVPSSKVLEYATRYHIHEHLAGLGRLVEVVFVTPGARQRQVTFTEDDLGQGVWLCASEDAKSLYIIGPVVVDLEQLGYRPDVDVKDAVELGRLTNVVYKTKKSMNNLDLLEYDHELGKRERWQKREGVGPDMNKEVAACPLLIYHTRENRLSVAGGQYLVMDVGITN